MRSGDVIQRLAVGALSNVISYQTDGSSNLTMLLLDTQLQSLTVVCGRSS